MGGYSEEGQVGGFSHPRWMSHLAGDRHHDLPGERRTARARPADGRTRVSPNNEAVRPDKGRNYTERGGAHSTVTFDSCCVGATAQRTPPLGVVFGSTQKYAARHTPKLKRKWQSISSLLSLAHCYIPFIISDISWRRQYLRQPRKSTVYGC
jgi:hypothetical protein